MDSCVVSEFDAGGAAGCALSVLGSSPGPTMQQTNAVAVDVPLGGFLVSRDLAERRGGTRRQLASMGIAISPAANAPIINAVEKSLTWDFVD